jgi:CBS domain-containing protein
MQTGSLNLWEDLLMLRDIINREVVSVDPDTKIDHVAKLMKEKDVGAVLVLSDGKPRGIITDRDIVLRCVAENLDSSDCSVESLVTDSVEVCKDSDGLYDCIEKMSASQVRRIPVVDQNGQVIGIVSFGDVLSVLSKELSELTSTTTAAGRTGFRSAA